MTKQEIKQAWEKFLNSKGVDVGIIIRCDTEKKANKLLKFLDKKGFKWNSGTRLIKENYWSAYQNEIYYNSIVTCEFENNFKTILDFDDIEKYLKKEKKVTLKKYSKTCALENPEIEDITQEAINIVQKWSDEHQPKTLLEDLLEKYPNAKKRSVDGLPCFCPSLLGYKNVKICTSPHFEYGENCISCWNRLLEEVDKE